MMQLQPLPEWNHVWAAASGPLVVRLLSRSCGTCTSASRGGCLKQAVAMLALQRQASYAKALSQGQGQRAGGGGARLGSLRTDCKRYLI